MTDIPKLREKIEGSGLKMKAISDKSGILRATLYNRLQGRGEFTASEIVSLSSVLQLSATERDEIFLRQS